MTDDSVDRIATIAERIRQGCKAVRPDSAQTEAILRIETPVPCADPLDWLRAQDHPIKTFWAERDGPFRMAGVGEADSVVRDSVQDLGAEISRIQNRLSPAYPRLRYYGGLSFSGQPEETQAWDKTGVLRFVLPRFELVVTAEEAFLACNLVWRDGWDMENALKDLAGIRFPGTLASASIPVLQARSDRPGHDEWIETTNQALEEVSAGELHKVVLARESRFTFAGPVDPCSILTALARNTVHSYGFCFQFDTGHAFLGATPERLYRRRGTRVESEALAGTRPRGTTPDTDAALAKELATDNKELREHGHVVDGIRQALEPLCDTVDADAAPAHLKLRDCQHLLSQVRGVLVEADSDAAIFSALHPTPAVAGVPTETAMETIAALEPFSRGWYAGPVGWLGYDEAEFAVAIRSGLVADRTLSLYAGAGILDGSTPEREWDEIENKMSTFLRVLTNHDR